MKNIVLFGGSNCVMKNGLADGIKVYANLTNTALDATSTLQNLYELLRERNQQAIKEADLIVTNSNISEIGMYNDAKQKLSLDIVFRDLQWFYTKLYELNKAIVVLIFPSWGSKNITINNMNIFLANYYGFSVIDMYNIYENKELLDFGKKLCNGHQFLKISREVGKNIAKNTDIFPLPKKDIHTIKIPEFKILTPENAIRFGDFRIFNPNNSAFSEIVYRLENQNYIKFNGYVNYNILGFHSWNLDENGEIRKGNWNSIIKNCGSISIKNDDIEIRTSMCARNAFYDIQEKILINDKTAIKFNDDCIKNSEFYWISSPLDKDAMFPKYFDMISIIICSPYNEKTLLNIDEIPDNEIIKIEPELDFTHLVPNVEFFRDCMEFIDEYAPRLYGGIERHIQAKFINSLNAKIASLENENKILKSTYHSAIKRVQNHLSYKLGRAMIENSKSIFGYFKMPFVLWRIKKKRA